MSIFKNTRRIVDHTVQKRLFGPSPSIANKDKKLLKKEELKNNQLIIEEVGYKRCRVVNKNISSQHMAKPRVSSIVAHNHITPRIYYEITNKDKTILEKGVIEKNCINRGQNVDRHYQLKRNEGVPKNNISQQRLPAKNIPKAIVYDIIPHNHIVAPFTGILSKTLKANRNQVIYHRVFNVPDEQRQTSLKPLKNVTWFAKRENEKKSASTPGRLGKLSSANESVFFFETERERLMKLKNKIKDKEKGPDAPKKS